MESVQGKYDVLDIARWFIWRYQNAFECEEEDRLSLLKLLKLVYYAEGCSLAMGNGSLYSDDIIAWPHGPVVLRVYEHYKNDPYNLLMDVSPNRTKNIITLEDRLTLESVMDNFGQYSAWGLRNLTHEETPWKQATENGRHFGGVMNRDIICEYFTEHYIVEE